MRMTMMKEIRERCVSLTDFGGAENNDTQFLFVCLGIDGSRSFRM